MLCNGQHILCQAFLYGLRQDIITPKSFKSSLLLLLLLKKDYFYFILFLIFLITRNGRASCLRACLGARLLPPSC